MLWAVCSIVCWLATPPAACAADPMPPLIAPCAPRPCIAAPPQGTSSSKKKKQAKLQRALAAVKKQARREAAAVHEGFAAVHLLHDPQVCRPAAGCCSSVTEKRHCSAQHDTAVRDSARQTRHEEARHSAAQPSSGRAAALGGPSLALPPV